MHHSRRTACVLLAAALLPGWLHGVEILEAGLELGTRFSGRVRTDEQFGSDSFWLPQHGNLLLGSAYFKDSRELVPVLGFRLTEAFLLEWEKQGQAQFIFSIVAFHEGDPHKICPIHIERLAPAGSAAEAAAQPSQERLGSIERNELQLDHLYSFPLAFQANLKPGDVFWIGLDSTNPFEPENNLLVIAGDLSCYPGGAPPILMAGSPEEASQMVHGISLLRSLNRSFYAPENETRVPPKEKDMPRWVNPLRTRRDLETLDAFRLVLKQELAKIPEPRIFVPERFKGFHSSVKSENETWELRFPLERVTTSVALYPAVSMNGAQVEAYAFPRRFTITAIPRDDDPYVVADWSQADFPHAGISPVIFPLRPGVCEELRITVQKGMPMPDGGYAFALSEVSFLRRWDTRPIPLETTPQDRLEILPYWSTSYATDGRTAFGSPVPSADASKGTFRTWLQGSDAALQISIRQAKPTTWNGFELYPTLNANELPAEAFPQRLQFEFSDQDDFSHILRTIHASTETLGMPDAEHPLVLRFPSIDARCVRISFKASRSHPDGTLIQLEEITFNGGLPFQMQDWYFEERTISGPPGTTALFDRIINGNSWHPPVQRTVNLIRRDILTEELQRLESTTQAIRRAHDQTVKGLLATAVVLASALSGIIIIHQRRQSKKAQLRIRHQIQQDLHDEIGSQLSTISMISNFNKNAPDLEPTLRTELTDINQSAREAIASLAEVIWLTDKEILTLDQCFDVMKKRARKMVHTMALDLDFPRQVPALRLSYRTKRNLILLFTEALNNGLKHSNADTLRVSARIDGHRQLTLVIADNGQGFAPDSDDAGIGLESMKERAAKLGGQLDITSSPHHGTTVTFKGNL